MTIFLNLFSPKFVRSNIAVKLMGFFQREVWARDLSELQFSVYWAAYSCNDVKTIITLTRNESKPRNSKIQQVCQLNTYSTMFRNSHGMYFGCE